jgi:hypothetical protein
MREYRFKDKIYLPSLRTIYGINVSSQHIKFYPKKDLLCPENIFFSQDQ